MGMKRKGVDNYDPYGATSNQYSDYAGAQKVSNVGHRLIPLQTASGWTCDASSRIKVARGATIAIYNNSGTVASVTTGDVTVSSQAPGSVQNGTPTTLAAFVGIPCKANDWTYINMFDHDFVITSAATCLVYVIQDHTVVG